jgi:hypothetical protein
MRRQGQSTHREKGIAEVVFHQPPDLQRILENIVFIAEVFANRPEEEIPDVPFLDLAKSFEVKKQHYRAPSLDAEKGG